MSFMPTGQQTPRMVPGEGPAKAKIAIVGEAPGAHEDRLLRPFVGPAGGVLESCLHAAGLIRSEVYLTNVIKVQPRGPKGPNDISPFFNGKTFSESGQRWVNELRSELDALSPNIIVACGGTALAACAGVTKVTKYRGYLFPTVGMVRVHKVIPTIHPAACLYDRRGGEKGALATSEFKPYLYRHIIVLDLQKAKAESSSPNLVRPPRQLAYDFANIEEVLEWLAYFEDQSPLSVDIEVLNYELSCIGFSADPAVAVSIPVAHRWTVDEEVRLWRALQRVLGNSKTTKIFQNGIFDIHFLATRCGLVVRGPIEDTMIGHSVMYPEFPKGLGFLGSIYCGAQEYWKDKVRFDDIKDNS